MGPRESLNTYIAEIKDRPFEWGKHDCLTFTNEAWRRMYGHGWGDDLAGHYVENNKPVGRYAVRDRLIDIWGSEDLASGLSERFSRVSGVPPLGALVSSGSNARWHIGVTLGISNGRRGVFLSEKGVIYMPITDIKGAWLP